MRKLFWTRLTAPTLLAVGVSLAVAAAGGARLAYGQPPGAPQPLPPPAAKPKIDQQAIAALNAMGAYLRSLKMFKVTAEMNTDDVMDSGQKVQYSGMAELEVRRPDRLHVSVLTERRNEQMFYDGKTFTMFQPGQGYYAQFKAPPSLAELMSVLEQQYGVDMPLGDLFYWGTEKSRVNEITAATRVGTSTIKGVKCDHYAFRQADVDWEVCIESGGRTLPVKLVITTSQEPTQPQHASVMTWNLSPVFNEKTFTFTPPAAATRIEFFVPKGGLR